MVSGVQVAAFLGSTDPALIALAGQHAAIVTAIARTYTRGNGFANASTPADDLAAVITVATARLVANPEQIQSQIGSVAMRGGFQGWSLAELFILNSYRGIAR